MNVNQPTGKFLKIIHRIDDALWVLGNKKIPENINFSKVEIKDENPNENNKENNNEINNENNNEINNENFEIKLDLEDNKNIPPTTSNQEEINTKENDNEINTQIQILSQEENDKNLEILFLTLAKLHFKDNTEIFPLDPGKLQKDFLRPLSLELNLPFDIKHSSYKKINNFLKHLHKDKNLINFTKPKGQQNDYIISINWGNQMITDFIPRIKKLKFLDKDQENEEKENVILNKDEKIEVSQLFKPNMKTKIFFEKIDKNFNNSQYYTLKHCNEILTQYLKEKDLFLKNGMVRIDPDLKNALFKDSLIDNCKIEEILLLWKKNLNEKSFITKTGANNDQTILTNTQLKVKIIAKKICNKNVTIIDGLQNFASIKDVIKLFSKHFACSVTTKDFGDMKNAIFIQGYWVSDLVQLLQDEIKLNKQFIIVQDKLNLKKK